MNVERLESALVALGDLLDRRAISYRAAVVGGGALLLLGLADRPTRDLDLVGRLEGSDIVSAEPLPAEVRTAVADVGRALGLAPDWLNAGPTPLLEVGLPEGFARRCHRRTYGGLELWLADRTDLIHLKLYAAVTLGPKSKHFADLRVLRPTSEELHAAAAWAAPLDTAQVFASDLSAAVAALERGGRE